MDNEVQLKRQHPLTDKDRALPDLPNRQFYSLSAPNQIDPYGVLIIPSSGRNPGPVAIPGEFAGRYISIRCDFIPVKTRQFFVNTLIIREILQQLG